MQRPAFWFATTGVALALLAVPSRIFASRYSPDLQVHDFYFVLSPDRVFLVMAAFSGMFAAAYAAFPMNRRAAGWHFWVTVSGITGFWISFCWWTYFVAQRASAQSISPRVETVAALAFVFSFLLLLFSPAIFAVNFTFAMGKMRIARKPR